MLHTIFVYGTLKRGFPNHALMQGATFVAEGTTRLTFPMVVQGDHFSPVIIPEAGQGHRINGEIWRLDDAQLACLDILEAVHSPTGYVRDKIEVESTDGQQHRDVWVYFKPRDRISIFHSAPHADYQDRRYRTAAKR